MDDLIFEQEWKRVAVDACYNTPYDQLQDILSEVEKGNAWMAINDIEKQTGEPNVIVLAPSGREYGRRTTIASVQRELWKMYRPDYS